MIDGWFGQARRILRPLRLAGVGADTSLDRMVADPALDDPSVRELHSAVDFTTKLAQALLGYGLPVHLLEQALMSLSRALGFEASFYLTPTGMIATFGIGAEKQTQVLVAVPGSADMERLAALHALVARVEQGELSPAEASRRVDAILMRPSRYGPAVTVMAGALLSVAVARLLAGSAQEMAWAGALGLGVALLGHLAGRWFALGRILPVLAALLASLGAFGLLATGWAVRPSVLLISSVIILVPGLTFTIAMLELATANLVSGTARLSGALVTFLQLGFGAAVGATLASFFDLPPIQQVRGLPEWTNILSALLASVCFVVLLRVRVRDTAAVLVACSLAIVGARLGGQVLGAEVGGFVGALGVGLVSHLYARSTGRPALVLLVPGILMLVPGTLGLLSLSSLLADDPTVALATGFQMFMVAMALTTGVLVATLAVPVKRSL
jgi:uncharacterized membrane protein YjjP (DUF1212 family)